MLNAVGEHSQATTHKDDIIIGQVDADRFDMVVAPIAEALVTQKHGCFWVRFHQLRDANPVHQRPIYATTTLSLWRVTTMNPTPSSTDESECMYQSPPPWRSPMQRFRRPWTRPSGNAMTGMESEGWNGACRELPPLPQASIDEHPKVQPPTWQPRANAQGSWLGPLGSPWRWWRRLLPWWPPSGARSVICKRATAALGGLPTARSGGCADIYVWRGMTHCTDQKRMSLLLYRVVEAWVWYPSQEKYI